MQFINGGQTGVDRAVLDFAVKYNIPYTGYVCDSEDLTVEELVEKYPNLINAGDDNIVRTKKNIEMADILVCICDSRTKGEKEVDSREFADEWIFFDVFSKTVLSDVLNWYRGLPKDVKLCVGGARESWYPGVYAETLKVLEKCKSFFN